MTPPWICDISRLTAMLLIGCSFTVPTFAADQQNFSFSDFSTSLANACGERWKRNGGSSGNPPAPQVCDVRSSQYQAQSATGGAWRLNLFTLCNIEASGYATGGTRPMMSYKMPAAVENFGNRMTFAFLTQAVTDEEVPLVEKQIQERRAEMEKEYKDTQVELVRANGAYTLVAVTDFSKGLDKDDVTDRLVWLTGQAQFLLCDITNGKELTRMAIWDRLKGADLTYLNKNEFHTLNPILHEGYKEESDGGKGGYWSAYYDPYKIWVQNQGEKMVLWLGVRHKPASSKEALSQATAAIQKWADKNKFENAEKMEVAGDDNWVYVGAHFPYKGLNGKQVMNLVKDFINEYAKDASEDVTDELDDYL